MLGPAAGGWGLAWDCCFSEGSGQHRGRNGRQRLAGSGQTFGAWVRGARCPALPGQGLQRAGWARSAAPGDSSAPIVEAAVSSSAEIPTAQDETSGGCQLEGDRGAVV